MNLLLLALAFVAQPADAKPMLRPTTVGQFYVDPGIDAVLRWEVTSGTLADPVEVVLRDLAGKDVTRVQAKRTGPRTVEATVRPTRGYFEVVVPASGQRFGLIALPAWQGAPDPFFAIDGGLSWLVRDSAARAGLIAAMARSGIGMVRERLTPGAVSPAPGRWEWETPQRFETLRQTYRAEHVAVLEMAHDAPSRLGRVGKYPADLLGWAALWNGIAARWRPVWGAVEVWNEPDISFGGDLPSDQYVPLAKALAFGFETAKVDVPLVGGVAADFKPPWLDAAGRSLLLDRVDVFSFHTYGSALQMEPLVGRFRAWLRAHHHGAMPLWITECGRPWNKGTDRPSIGQDARSALDITMKAVEARACGIARYFPFVLPYYEENTNNFGMTDRRATPLLSLAAYAQMIRALGNRPYLGDLRHDAQGLQRARVFGDGRNAVAVLYNDRVEATATLPRGLPVVRAEGIDGRPLVVAADGSVPIPDGLVYAWLDATKLGDRLVTETPAKKLHADAGQPARRTASPIVLRYQYDAVRVAPTSVGYLIKDASAHTLPVSVRVFNLGGEAQPLRLALRLEAGSTVRALPVKGVSVEARSSVDESWDVDTTGLFDANERVTVMVDASDASGLRDRVALGLVGEPDLERTLKRLPGAVRLPIGEPSRWTANHSPGTVTMESSPGSSWRMTVKYTTRGDHWAYPYFRLPDRVTLSPSSTLYVRARCQGQASVRMFLWEGDGGVGYITPDSLIASDGRWHVARVRLADLIASNANAPDPNARLDPDAVRKISLGMNARSSQATLDVSDVYAVGKDSP